MARKLQLNQLRSGLGSSAESMSNRRIKCIKIETDLKKIKDTAQKKKDENWGIKYRRSALDYQ